MFPNILFRHFAAAALLGLAVVLAASAAGDATADRSIPQMAAVQQAVSQYFQTLDDYQPGDWITQASVRPLLKRLQKMGLPLPDAEKILADVPTGDEFLSEQLGTPKGRKFMRQIAQYPNAYDRLDRMSRLSNGRRLVRELIRGPGGDRMIEYMTTSSGGRELGRMLSNAPSGADFNEPTGRIYTADLLLARLEQSRNTSVEAAKKRQQRR